MSTCVSRYLALGMASVFLNACCVTPQKLAVAQASGFMELSTAIEQVQNAVAASRLVAPDKKVGVVVSKVTVSLKLASSNTDSTGQAETIGIVLPPVSLGGSVTETSASANSSENTITLEFSNPMLLPEKDTLLGAILTNDDPQKQRQLLKRLDVLQPVETIKQVGEKP